VVLIRLRAKYHPTLGHAGQKSARCVWINHVVRGLPVWAVPAQLYHRLKDIRVYIGGHQAVRCCDFTSSSKDHVS